MGDYEYEDDAPSQPKKKRGRPSTQGDDEFVAAEPKKPKGLAALTSDEKDRLVNDVVRFFLFTDSTKIPIKQADISKKVTAGQKVNGPSLIPLAKQKLADVFGWDLIEIPTFSTKGKLVDAAGKGSFILRRKGELEKFLKPIKNEFTPEPLRPFTMITLSIILMSNYTIEEGEFYEQLASFGLKKSEPHQIINQLENVEAAVKLLERQGYLDKNKQKEGGQPCYEYSMGPRALLEIGKANVLKFVNHICETRPDPGVLKELMDEQVGYFDVIEEDNDVEIQPEQIEEVQEAPEPVPERRSRSSRR